MYDAVNGKIDVYGTDISVLESLSGELMLAEETIVEGRYIVEGREDDGSLYSTIIEDVEKVTLTTDDVEYFGTGNLTGSEEDSYELLIGGQGDLGQSGVGVRAGGQKPPKFAWNKPYRPKISIKKYNLL